MADETKESPDHHEFYAQAEAYDIAFDFRDMDRECNALDEICLTHRGARPRSFVDLGCGPGYHCIHYSKRGLRGYGVDINEQMIAYARGKAARLAADTQFIVADMRDFTLPSPVDLAFCAMATFHYLQTNDDIVAHFQAVARNLTPGGLYLLEANHPRDLFTEEKSTKNEWEAGRGGIVVHSAWGIDDISVDPITQISKSTVRIVVERDETTQKWEFTNIDRLLTHQELQLLIEKSGVFDAPAWLGALDVNQPFDNTKDSWRMIPVLRRR